MLRAAGGHSGMPGRPVGSGRKVEEGCGGRPSGLTRGWVLDHANQFQTEGLSCVFHHPEAYQVERARTHSNTRDIKTPTLRRSRCSRTMTRVMSKSSSSSLLRDTPDGGASSAPHPYLFLLLSWLTGLLVYLILPLYIPYLTIQYLLTPRPFPRWTLRRFLRQRTNKLWVHISQWWLPVEESFEEAWSVPTSPGCYGDAKRRGELGIEVVSIPPVEGLRRGVAECRWVEAMKRPGFMLSPKGARGRGMEKAKVGEKVFLHIHGG
jgi:hypothetical protein